MYRISIHETISLGEYSYVKDVESHTDFITYLKQEGIKKINLKYRSILDDIPDF